MFEERVDQILYPELSQIGAISAFGKLKSKKLNITSKQFQFNPDWDENIILNLFNLFGNEFGWTPPNLPEITKCIIGKRQKIDLAETELLAPVETPSKFLAIGLNYKKHRQETIDAGITPPRNQMWFTKQTSCINSPYGNIIKPDATMMLDYEVELAFIVGKKCYQVSADKAQDYIFGYMICNDISMRDWQLHNMPDRLELMIGKSHDSHGPVGPWIVTRDEIEDPHKLKLECFVNGDLRQSSNTDDMIWNCYQQIEYLSSAMTLNPGDIIATGTPPGSGFSPRGASGKADKERKGNVFLEPGDVVKCEIESIGFIENKVI